MDIEGESKRITSEDNSDSSNHSLLIIDTTLQGFDPYSTTCFRNTTHLVAIFGSLATNVIIGSDIWALWPPKLCVALVISSVARGRC